MSTNVSKPPLLQQTLIIPPINHSVEIQLRRIIFLRLSALPCWPIDQIEAHNLNNLFMSACGMDSIQAYELDDFRRNTAFRWASKKPLFLVHPVYRKIFSTNRTVLLKNLPNIAYWPSDSSVTRRIMYTNVFLAACGFHLLSPVEEHYLVSKINIDHLYETLSVRTEANTDVCCRCYQCMLSRRSFHLQND